MNIMQLESRVSKYELKVELGKINYANVDLPHQLSTINIMFEKALKNFFIRETETTRFSYDE